MPCQTPFCLNFKTNTYIYRQNSNLSQLPWPQEIKLQFDSYKLSSTRSVSLPVLPVVMNSCPARIPCYSIQFRLASFPPQCVETEPASCANRLMSSRNLTGHLFLHPPAQLSSTHCLCTCPGQLMQGHRWHTMALSQRRRPATRLETRFQAPVPCPGFPGFQTPWIPLRLVRLDSPHLSLLPVTRCWVLTFSHSMSPHSSTLHFSLSPPLPGPPRNQTLWGPPCWEGIH